MRECEVCGVDIEPEKRKRGRPTVTCGGDACRTALDAKHEAARQARIAADPVLAAKRYGTEVKSARKRDGFGSGDWETCLECGEPVDCSLLGPLGHRETGYDTHMAPHSPGINGRVGASCYEDRKREQQARDETRRQTKG